MPFILRHNGTRPEEQFGFKNDLYILRVDPWHLKTYY